MGFDCNTTGKIVLVCYMSGAEVSTVEFVDASNTGKFKQAPDADCEIYRKDELASNRDRIGEIMEAHDAETLATLRGNRGARQPGRALIFQPCWSSRRWKSLT